MWQFKRLKGRFGAVCVNSPLFTLFDSEKKKAPDLIQAPRALGKMRPKTEDFLILKTGEFLELGNLSMDYMWQLGT